MSGTTQASSDFKSTLSEILGMFNQSALLNWTYPYADAYGFVQQYNLTKETLNDVLNPMTFGVQLLPNAHGDDYEYNFLANESCLYPLLKRKFYGTSEKEATRLSPEEQKIVSSDDVLSLFTSKFGSSEGYIKYLSMIRYIMMHEACHVWLAHQARAESILNKHGHSLYKPDGSINEEDQLALYALRVFNIIQDAFINIGMDELKKTEEAAMCESLRKSYSNLASASKIAPNSMLSAEDIRKVYGNQYMYDGTYIDGVRAPELIKQLKEIFNKSKLTDVQKSVTNKLLEDIEKGQLLNSYDDDFVCETVFMILKDNPQAIPQHTIMQIPLLPAQGQGQSQQQQGQGQSQGEGEGEGEEGDQQQQGQGKGQGQGQDQQQGEGEGEGQQQPGQGQGQQQGQGQGQEGNQPPPQQSPGQGQQKKQAIQNQPGTGPGSSKDHAAGKKIYAVVGPDGKVGPLISPGLSGDAAAKSSDKLNNAGRRQSAELQGMMDSGDFNEYMSNDDNGRGFGSVFGRCLEALNKVEFSWEDAISAFVKSLPGIKDEKSWARKNIPYYRVGISYPGEFLKRKPEDEYAIMLMIDTSGSMSQEEVRRMLGSILSAVGESIQRLYVVFHDYDVTDMSKSIDVNLIQKYRKVIDKKFLKEYGILKLELGGDDSKRTSKMLEEVVKIAASNLACGGTSHVVPLTTLGDNGAFKAIKERLSGLLMYTDCGSDLESVPQLLDQYAVNRVVKLNDNQVRIINSERGMQYQHQRYDVIAMDKLVEAGKKNVGKTR